MANMDVPHRAAIRSFAKGLAASPRSACSSCWVCWPRRRSYWVQAFRSWPGLRGAVSIVLIAVAIVRGVPPSNQLLNIVFVLVVLCTLVQGPALAPLTHYLRLAPPDTAREIAVEAAPLDAHDVELLTIMVTPESRLRSVSIVERRCRARAPSR